MGAELCVAPPEKAPARISISQINPEAVSAWGLPALVDPIVSEVEQVMTVQRGAVLSLGTLLTIWFAVGGVDGVRVGINRAYGIRETRLTVVLYGLQAAVVVLASLVLDLVGCLLVLAPRAGSLLHTLMPSFDPASVKVSLIRFPTAAVILVAPLFGAHVFLPARRTRFSSIWPGVLFKTPPDCAACAVDPVSSLPLLSRSLLHDVLPRSWRRSKSTASV